MKNILLNLFAVVMPIMIFGQQPRTVPLPYNSNVPSNYIKTYHAMAPEGNAANVISRNSRDMQLTTVFLDGLGRELQTVSRGGSKVNGSNALDLVSAIEYDEFGMERHKYLPFVAGTSDGSFKLNPFQQQEVFFNGQFGSQNESFFYSKTDFEKSPLSRPVATYAAGNSWVGSETFTENSRRNVQLKYFNNTTNDAVRKWNVDEAGLGQWSTYQTPGFYPAGELTKSITIDEHKKQVIEFTDKSGQVILKKVQLTAAIDGGSGTGHNGWLCTYYIYDDNGRLRCVIQPGAVVLLDGNWNLTTTLLAEQCFRYEYDQRNRMIIKKVPGAGEIYMVYDARDRLVMTQDANMRQGTVKWMVTKYDEINRPVETGLLANNLSFTTHRQAAYYSENYPDISNNFEQLSLIHYDDYAGLPGGLSPAFITTWNSHFSLTDHVNWPYPQMPVQNFAVKGMPTWKKVKVLGTVNTYLYSVTIYDDKGRTIQIQNKNISGGIDVVTTQYSWAGLPLITIHKQEKQGANSQTTEVFTRMSYDDLGRVIQIEKKQSNSLIGGGAIPGYAIISTMEYDAFGKLKKKKIGSKKDPSTNAYIVPRQPLEELEYDYNIRGWLLGTNRNYVKDANSDNYFGFDLGYDKTLNGLINNQAYTAAQYNGNITGMVWKSKGDAEKRKYDFSYDAANRLLKADFTQYASTAFTTNSTIDYNVKMGSFNPTTGESNNDAYDANGNILRMQQWGLKINSSTKIDDLNYQYNSASNRLLSVTELSLGNTDNKLGDFTDKNGSNDDYSYDVNGNLILDKNKGISSITYNHLNLPSVITITGKGNISYTYDAGGNKIKKVTEETGAVVPLNGVNYTTNITSTTTYLDGFVYESKSYSHASLASLSYADKLQFFLHEEGRIRIKEGNGNTGASLHYDFMLKDHLGNVRMVLTEEVKIDQYPPASMETAQATTEEQLYANLNTTRSDKPAGYPTDTYTNPNEKVARVKAAAGSQKIGPAIVLKVMAGDNFSIRVSSWYKTYGASPGQPVSPLADLISALTGSVGGISSAHGGATATELLNTGVLTPGATQFLNNQVYNTNRPKAFINWIILDEQFKFVSSSSDCEQVGANEEFKIHVKTNLPISKSGYLYIYVSNETPNIDVFFDNLQVTHTRGQILEETHYYPFGLTMSGISYKAAGGLINKKGYNGNELQNKEFSDGGGLEFYDFNARTYDQQIGKFIQVDPESEEGDQESWSPYHFSYNNPITYSDPDGRLPIIPIIWGLYEVGSAIYDGYQAYKTVSNKNSSGREKAAAVGGVFLSAVLPGGGYGTAAKATVKAVNKATDVAKVEKRIKNAVDGAAREAKVTGELRKEGKEILEQRTIYGPDGKALKVDSKGRKLDQVEVKDGKATNVYETTSPTEATRSRKVNQINRGDKAIATEGAHIKDANGNKIPFNKDVKTEVRH